MQAAHGITPQAPGSGGVSSFSMYATRLGRNLLTPGLSWALGSSFQPRIRGSWNLEYSKSQMQTERGNQARGHAEGRCEVL